eukprot:1103266-Pyramimonas_sp.AAC.1
MPAKSRASPLRDRLSGWWTQLHTLLYAQALHRRKNNGEAQQRRHRDSVKTHAETCPERARTVLLPGKDIEWHDWQAALSDIGACSVHMLDGLVHGARRIC